MKPKSKARPKNPRNPIHLPSFGCVNELYFDRGGYARVQMNTSEISRLLQALERYVLRKQRIPETKLLSALDTLKKYFSVVGRGYDITVTADMVIAAHGVYLEPIDKPISLNKSEADW